MLHFHSRTRVGVLVIAGACCFAMAVAGCGDTAGIGPTVPVVGTITVDGEPVKAGTLSFRPDHSKGNTTPHEPYGEIDPQGKYKLFTGKKEGAPVGWYRVAIMAGEPLDPNNLAGGQARWFANPKFATADSSGLTVEVVEKPAPGAYDFKLTK